MSYAVENHATSGAHVRLTPGTIINNQYEVVGEAGSGNFARVFECRDIRTNARMAIKLMKPGYERDADFEMDVLNAVNKNDPNDTCGIVRCVEKIRWNGYTGLAFTLKGKPLKNQRCPMSKGDIVQVGKDVANALHFLHFKCKAVHTDLKPENVLAEIDPSKPQKWVVCDFGSASFYTSALDNDLITTRPYRAPEVILKRGWNYHADTWSLGCILYELFTGKKLFDAQSDAEHLEVMQSRLGPIPASLHPPRTLAGNRRGYRPLKDELAHEPQLLQVIEKLLQYDPNQRPRCGDILSMPFFTGASCGKSVSATSAAASSVAAAGITNENNYYVKNATVVRKDSFGQRLSTLTSSNTNVQAPTTKTSFSGLTASSMYRLQQAQSATTATSSSSAAAAGRPSYGSYGTSSAAALGVNLPHPSQLPKPSAAAPPGAAAGSRGGIMSPAIPSGYGGLH